jgi:hypothetical protein
VAGPNGKLREAIQKLARKLDCFVAAAPRNDDTVSAKNGHPAGNITARHSPKPMRG